MVEVGQYKTFNGEAEVFEILKPIPPDELPSQRQPEEIAHAPLSFPLSEDFDSSIRELVPKVIEIGVKAKTKLSDQDLTILVVTLDFVGIENPDEFHEAKTIEEMQKRFKRPPSWIRFYRDRIYEEERLLPIFEALIPNPQTKPQNLERIHIQEKTHPEIYRLVVLARQSKKGCRAIVLEIERETGIRIGRTQVRRIVKEVEQ